MSCPICEKRRPERFCPAMGEKICAVCCGRERGVTIDCPSDCSYLLAAHRYEREHRTPLSEAERPYRDVEFSVDFVYERWAVVAGLAGTIIGFHAENKDLHDADVFAALEAIAETTRTLGTGIYYERPPDAPLPRVLYGRVAEFLQDFKKQESSRTGITTLKDSDVFRLLVFLFRVGKQETNGRPRSRAFLDFLRVRFALPASAPKEAPRIIIP
ncbi:MAG: hypothetical protein ACRD5M_09800 [Candidatus Acidiferrales bacterium]